MPKERSGRNGTSVESSGNHCDHSERIGAAALRSTEIPTVIATRCEQSDDGMELIGVRLPVGGNPRNVCDANVGE